MLPLEEGDHLDNVNWIWDWSSRPEAVPPRSIAVVLCINPIASSKADIYQFNAKINERVDTFFERF